MKYIIGAVLALTVAAATPRTPVGAFSSGSLEGWNSKRFEGETSYRIVTIDGRRVLRADSDGSASGLYREVSIDLTEQPWMQWSWKVDHTLGELDEHSKGGDDYAARVYVVFSGGLFFWRTRAINYVWSNNQPVGSRWTNPFIHNAKMIAVATDNSEVGQWTQEKRNVRQDYRDLFGEDADHLDAVAIMTDTDNSGSSATAWYGDIYFTAH